MDIADITSSAQLDSWLAEHSLGGHWQGLPSDKLEFRPFIWKWADIHAALMKATEVVPMHETGRRTIQMRNPSLGGRVSNTMQCVLPGEVAEAHRHYRGGDTLRDSGRRGCPYDNRGRASPDANRRSHYHTELDLARPLQRRPGAGVLA